DRRHGLGIELWNLALLAMARKLPVYPIRGIPVYVEIQIDECREVGDVLNSNSYDELLFWGDHYELLFEREEKNVFTGDMDEVPGLAEVEFVKIPLLHELDPEGMEQRCQIKFNAPRHDRGLHL